MTTAGAIFTWGSGRSPDAALAQILRKYRITLMIDVGARDIPQRPWGTVYSLARGGERILLLDKKPDPRGTMRHNAVLLPIARDAARYAESALAGVVTPIELGHIVGGKVVGPLELEAEAAAEGAKRGKAKRRGS